MPRGGIGTRAEEMQCVMQETVRRRFGCVGLIFYCVTKFRRNRCLSIFIAPPRAGALVCGVSPKIIFMTQ